MKNIKTKRYEGLKLIKNNIKELLEIQKKAININSPSKSYFNILKKKNKLDSCFKFFKKYSILSYL